MTDALLDAVTIVATVRRGNPEEIATVADRSVVSAHARAASTYLVLLLSDRLDIDLLAWAASRLVAEQGGFGDD